MAVIARVAGFRVVGCMLRLKLPRPGWSILGITTSMWSSAPVLEGARAPDLGVLGRLRRCLVPRGVGLSKLIRQMNWKLLRQSTRPIAGVGRTSARDVLPRGVVPPRFPPARLRTHCQGDSFAPHRLHFRAGAAVVLEPVLAFGAEELVVVVEASSVRGNEDPRRVEQARRKTWPTRLEQTPSFDASEDRDMPCGS